MQVMHKIPKLTSNWNKIWLKSI